MEEGSASDPSIRAFVSHQRSLLDCELRSETGEEREAASSAAAGGGGGREEARPRNVLRRLEVGGVRVGLYGRTVVELRPRGGGRPRGHRSGMGMRTVVAKTVAAEEEEEEEEEALPSFRRTASPSVTR